MFRADGLLFRPAEKEVEKSITTEITRVWHKQTHYQRKAGCSFLKQKLKTKAHLWAPSGHLPHTEPVQRHASVLRPARPTAPLWRPTPALCSATTTAVHWTPPATKNKKTVKLLGNYCTVRLKLYVILFKKKKIRSMCYTHSKLQSGSDVFQALCEHLVWLTSASLLPNINMFCSWMLLTKLLHFI